MSVNSKTSYGDTHIFTNNSSSDTITLKAGPGETLLVEGGVSYESLATVQAYSMSAWVTAAAAEANDWRNVVWSPEKGKFVAVAIDGTNRVQTSTDGTTWVTSTASELNEWRDVTYSAELDLFVAVATSGTNRKMYSSDGSTWVTATSSADQWRCVCWSPELGIFTSLATNIAAVAYSQDGKNWTTANSGAGIYTHNAIAWSPELNMFVSVTSARPCFSYDGITWETGSEYNTNDWRDVCWSPELGMFVAVSADGTNRVMYSTNGTTWDSATAAEDNAWYSVCWSAQLKMFVAVAGSGTNRVMYSTNGTTWNSVLATQLNTWRGVTYSPALGIFVGVAGDGTNQVMKSTNILDGTLTLTANIGTPAVTDVNIYGKALTVGNSASSIEIGKYCDDINIGGIPIINGMIAWTGTYAVITDSYAANSSGGNATTATWADRYINVLQKYGPIDCSLSPTNTFDSATPANTVGIFYLGKGNYYINASSPFLRSNGHQLRLQDTTNSTTKLVGTVGFCSGSVTTTTQIFVSGIITILDDTKPELRLQYFCESPVGGADTLGGNVNSATESKFSQITVIKIGD